MPTSLDPDDPVRPGRGKIVDNPARWPPAVHRPDFAAGVPSG
jgi:hypothetical protein